MIATLTDRQTALLREAAENNGEIYIGDFTAPDEVKAAEALVRNGMLSCGTPRGWGYHAVTKHGWAWLALVDHTDQESQR